MGPLFGAEGNVFPIVMVMARASGVLLRDHHYVTLAVLIVVVTGVLLLHLEMLLSSFDLKELLADVKGRLEVYCVIVVAHKARDSLSNIFDLRKLD